MSRFVLSAYLGTDATVLLGLAIGGSMVDFDLGRIADKPVAV